jgi:hypothetical protein
MQALVTLWSNSTLFGGSPWLASPVPSLSPASCKCLAPAVLPAYAPQPPAWAGGLCIRANSMRCWPVAESCSATRGLLPLWASPGPRLHAGSGARLHCARCRRAQAPRPNHFLALQVSHEPSVVAAIQKVQAAVAAHSPHLKKACVEAASSHLTLGRAAVLQKDIPRAPCCTQQFLRCLRALMHLTLVSAGVVCSRA